MNCLSVFTIALAAMIAAMPQAKPQPSADEIAIRNIIQEEITAWNAGDAVAYSARHLVAIRRKAIKSALLYQLSYGPTLLLIYHSLSAFPAVQCA
jgi:hypothetical protein